MIDATILPFFTGLFPIICAITLLVLRAGASRVFFDIVGTFQADRLIHDAKASKAVFEALYLDTFSGIQEAGQEIGDMFTDMLDVVIPVTREIEEARIQLEKFLDADAGQMRELAEDIQDIGLEFGFAADSAMEAGAKMAQLSGVLGTASLPVGTEVGMMFGLISGMETDVAMQRLINLQQQTKFMTENVKDEMSEREKANQIRRDSIRVLDQLNTVENRSVATMEQITFVMNQFASQAQLTNESIASMAALSATLIEAGEEQGKGGRALRMMYARLGADINGSRKAVEDLGIAVADNEGNMRALSDVLVDLAAAYHTMSGEEQTALAQQVAGNRHYTRLIKLLENVDRVKELEFEATIAMFPAMDEIDRRRDTELFKLQEAEAAYKNYTGQLGDELLPVLTSVTKRQTEFTKSLVDIAQTPFIGQLIKMPLGIIKTFQAFAGPATSMLLSLQNINVAMQTQAVISRALKGDQIATLEGGAKGGQLLIDELALRKQIGIQEKINNLEEARARRDELNEGKVINAEMVGRSKTRLKTIARKKRLQSAANVENRDNLAKVIDQQKALEMQVRGVDKATKKQLRTEARLRQKNLDLQKEKRAGYRRMRELALQEEAHEAKIYAFREKEARREAYSNELKKLKIKNESKEMLNHVGALMSVGTAFMMLPDALIPFLDKQQEMKIGIALNTAAFTMQTLALILNSKEAITNALSKATLTREQIKEGIALEFTTKEIAEQSGVTLGLIDAQVAATGSTSALAGAQTGLGVAVGGGKKSVIARMGGFVAALPKPVHVALVVGSVFALAEVINHFSGKTKKATDSLVDFNKASLDTGMVMEYIKLEEIDINAALKERSDLYETLKDSEDELMKKKAESLLMEMKALDQAKRIKEFSSEDFDLNPAKDLFAAEKEIDRLNNKFGKGYLPDYFSSMDGIFEVGPKQMTNMLMDIYGGKGELLSKEDVIRKNKNIINEIAKNHKTLVDFIELHKITTFEELEATADSFGTSINELINEEALGVSNLTKEYSLLSNEVEGFANTREEMFYGFDRNNLTGDLVRQVTQQGVETLITNTELIMTNNFNGITDVQDMVNTILDELESQGIGQGAV